MDVSKMFLSSPNNTVASSLHSKKGALVNSWCFRGTDTKPWGFHLALEVGEPGWIEPLGSNATTFQLIRAELN